MTLTSNEERPVKEDVTLRPSTGLAVALVIPMIALSIAVVSTNYEAQAAIRKEMVEGYVTKEASELRFRAARDLADQRFQTLTSTMHRFESKLDRALDDSNGSNK